MKQLLAAFAIASLLASQGFSADLGTEVLPKKQVLPSPLSPDMTVIGWVRGDTIQLPSGANIFLVTRLNQDDPVACHALLFDWSEGRRDFIFDEDIDRPYANAWLLIHSANIAPPNTLDKDNPQGSKRDYRLFSRFRAEYKIADGLISESHFHQSLVDVGNTPDPCAPAFSAAPEVPAINGFKGPITARTEMVQVNQGRIGDDGKAIDTTLNDPGGLVDQTTPWIWSVIRFDTAGKLSSDFSGQCSPATSRDRQIFPTYSIYTTRNLSDFKQQCDPEQFIALDQNSRLTTP